LGETMSALSKRLRLFYLLHFAKPAVDRQILRVIAKMRVCSILELGVGNGQRALRMLEVASLQTAFSEISYTGVDLFEARDVAQGLGMSLKEAHKLFHAAGARARLVPGDPYSALSRVANTLGEIDLVVISTQVDRQSMAKAWFYLPRMLHRRSKVVLEQPGRNNAPRRALVLSAARVEQIAAKANASRRAA
jgi:hypothetical protein